MAANLKFPFFQLHFSSGHFLYLISIDIGCISERRLLRSKRKINHRFQEIYGLDIYKENNQPFPSLLFESKKNLILTICYALVSSVIPLPIIIFFATAQKL